MSDIPNKDFFSNTNDNSQSSEEDSNFLSDLDFIKFILVARKNIGWVIILFIIGFCIAFLYNRYTTPIYQSSSSIKLVVKNKGGGFSLVSGAGIADEKLSNINSEIELIRSNLVFNQVIEALNHEISYYSKGKILDFENYKSNVFDVLFDNPNSTLLDSKIIVIFNDKSNFEISYQKNGQEKKINGKTNQEIQLEDTKLLIKINQDDISKYDNKEYYFYINSRNKRISEINRNLKVEVQSIDGSAIKISYNDPNPTKARDIVAAFDTIYIKESIASEKELNYKSIAFINETLQQTEDKMDKYEKMMQAFMLTNKTADIRSEFTKAISKLEEVDKEIEKEEFKLKCLKDLENFVLQNNKIEKSAIPSIADIPDDQINLLISSLNTLNRQKEILLITNKENTLAVKTVAMDINSLKKNILELINKNQKLVSEVKNSIIEKKVAMEDRFFSFPSKDTEYKKLQRHYTLHERYYTMMIDKKTQYDIANASTFSEIKVLSSPTINNTPVFPQKTNAYLFAVLGSLFISILLILVKYFLHNTINNIGELEKLTSAPVLGFVPKFLGKKMAVSKLIVDKNPKGAISESLRSIRTNLEFIQPSKGKQVFGITSTISGEGKTFVSLNLSGIMAFSNKKVCIIDLDLRKPKIHQSFEENNDKGISTILIGRNDWKECVKTTSIANLDFISSGPIPPNPTELIISDAFDKLLEELKLEYDIIVIDTPPVGLVTDGILIMKHVDIPIYVVRAEYSKKGFERNINKMINKNGFKKLCIILNDFDNMQGYGYGYQYGYGYGYGYYSQEITTKKSWLKKIFN